MQLNRPFESIEEKDLQSLVDNRISEQKTIEYKETLPGKTDSERKEFLADISSFANAAGGRVIYGIKADAGIPVDLCGLHSTDVDAEILRLEEMVRDGIRPRIPGVQARAVQVKTDKFAIVFHIPRSWALPHQVTYQKTCRFFSRGTNGKYILDVDELRAAFILTERIADRIKNFRIERLSTIIAGQGPLRLGPDPKMVLHIVPIASFGSAARYELFSLTSGLIDSLRPLFHESGESEGRYNFDGLLIASKPCAYTQLFRNGSIEAADAHIFWRFGSEDDKIVNINLLEDGLLYFTPRYLSMQKKMGIEPPFIVMVSIFGVSGVPLIQYTQTNYAQVQGQPIDRNDLILPDVMVESYESKSEEFMKPILDTIWNAAGMPRSLNYDGSGARIRVNSYSQVHL